MWTIQPLALRVAFSPFKIFSNSLPFAEGETRPLSNIDSEVGQEPRGWELGSSHGGTSQPLETEVENTVSRIRVKLFKTNGLLTERSMWVTSDQTQLWLSDCQVLDHFQDLRISVGYDEIAWKTFSCRWKDLMCASRVHWTSPASLSVSRKRKTIFCRKQI